MGQRPYDGGNWNKTLNGLVSKAYRMTAKDLSDISQPVSDPWDFNVVDAQIPSITGVVDADGKDIQSGGTTFSTGVTLTGTAAAGKNVQILDATALLGTVPATGGIWTLALTNLAHKAYSIRAIGQYGGNPESSARSFTILLATAPMITRVQDSKGTEIPNNTETEDTRVTLIGTASSNEQVELLDGANRLTTLTATGGNWTYTLSTTPKSYSIKARGLYGGFPESGIRTFRVKQATPPLIIDTGLVTLAGKFYGLPAYPNHPPAQWPANTTITRVPTSGVPPYTYTSSDPLVASVNNSGFVNVNTKKGTAFITVRDSANQTASYTVNVTGVVSAFELGRNTYVVAVDSAAANGLRIPTMAELAEITAIYGGGWPMGGGQYWSSEACKSIPPHHYSKDLITSGWMCSPSGPFGGHCNIVGIA